MRCAGESALAEASTEGSRRGRWLRAALLAGAILLWLVYAVPLFDPPPAELEPPSLGSSLLERIYPGVPSAWVALRLVCLAGAVAFAAISLVDPFVRRLPPAAPVANPVSPVLLRGLLPFAAVHACAGLWAEDLGRGLQLLYIGMLAVPAMILVLSTWRWRPTLAGVRSRAMLILVVGVLLVSLPLGAWPTWRSPRIANISDAASTFEGLAATMDPDFNLLTDEVRPALTALHMVFQGAGLFSRETVPLTVPWVQGGNIFWNLITAGGLARLAWVIAGPPAAPVAAAVFLFSPYILMSPMFLASVFFTPFLTVMLLLLAWAIERRASVTATVAFGPLAGIAMTHPVMATAALPVCIHVVWRAMRKRLPSGRTIPIAATVISLCSFTAAAYPGLPDLERFTSAAKLYGSARQNWVAMEAVGLGIVEPRYSEFHTRAGRAGSWDVPLSAALSPVAFPRSSLRLLGDVLFEPCGTGLALLGIVACMRWRRHDWSLLLIVLLAITVVPGFVSSYDRPSLTRMSVLPVPMALLAAIGFQALFRRLEGRLRDLCAVGTAVAVVAGGAVLYWVVTPTVVPRTALAIALQAIRGESAARVAVIAPARPEVLFWALFASHVPATPVAAVGFHNVDSLGAADDPVAEIVFWSPGFEDEAHVSSAICARWPQAEIFVLSDETGIGHVFAARLGGEPWTPVLPDEQWHSGGCGTELATEGHRAAAVIETAKRLVAEGRHRQAIATLRPLARQSFAQPQLFDLLAQLLIAYPGSPADSVEAVGWAQRAFEIARARELHVFDTLARAHAAAGHLEEAARVAGEAESIARDRGDLVAAEMFGRRRLDYLSRGAAPARGGG